MILQAADEAPAVSKTTFSPHSRSVAADRELQRRIRTFLDNRQFPQSSRLTIEAENGVVTLRGTHRSYYHKQLCINYCQRVAGVVRLVDATQVLSPSSTGR